MSLARGVTLLTPGRGRGAEGAAIPQRLGRVLVVEDERDVAELIRYNLVSEGYEVLLATNGTDALRMARESHPDVVLLDIMVPQLNGWEVCLRLKQDPALAGIAVVMVTGRVAEGDKVLGFELGADDYVTKPFSPRELVARVRAVARRGKPADGKGKKAHLKAGDLEIDRHCFEVRMKGTLVELTPKEFDRGRPPGAAPRQIRRGEARRAPRRDRPRRGIPVPRPEIVTDS